MDILILGHNGMLGHMAYKYFNYLGFKVSVTDFRFSSVEFKEFIKSYNGYYIINCIGAIPQKTSQFDINYELPIWLDINSNCKIIHPGTDCELDNDNYGLSKMKSSSFIKSHGVRTKIIKASIIGPELHSKYSLFEWFINNKDNIIKGWKLAMWNGITTLEWCKHCNNLMQNWDMYKIENIIESTCLSKYDLLKLIGKIFNIEKQIEQCNTIILNKCLKGDIKSSNIETQLYELKEYYYENK